MTVSIVNKVAWPIGSKGSINPMLWKYGKLQEQIGSAFSDAAFLVDFVQEKYHVNKVPFADIFSYLTFARASGGTRINSSGVLELMAANTPRFDYDPVTLAPRGILIEERRTNLLLRSEEFDNAAWTKLRTTVVANGFAGPDGASTADKLIEDATTGSHIMVQGAAVTAGAAYTFSFFLRASERVSVLASMSVSFPANSDCVFDASTGVATNVAATSVSMVPVGNGWYRCSVTATADATGTGNMNLYLRSGTSISYTGNGTSGIYIWGAQLEQDAFATSYIPSSGAATTREADILTCTGTNFSSWYRADEGTVFAQGTLIGGAASSFPRIVSAAGDNANANSIDISWRVGFAMRGGCTANDVQTFDAEAGPSKQGGAFFKSAIAFRQNDSAFATDSIVSSTDTSVTIPTASKLLICGVARYQPIPNARIEKIAFFPRRLSNAELQVLTS